MEGLERSRQYLCSSAQFGLVPVLDGFSFLEYISNWWFS